MLRMIIDAVATAAPQVSRLLAALQQGAMT
jgi:hypothetical protein